MIKTFASLLLVGDTFSPKKLQQQISHLIFRKANEKGALEAKTGHVWGYGSAIINHPSHLGKEGKQIAWEDMLAFLRKHHQTLRACGVEDINLKLNFFYPGDGASWHIEAEDIQTLAQLGIGLSIDWYQIAEEQAYTD